MNLDEMVERVPGWLTGEGELPELVISSRARLARNLAGHLFGVRATLSEKRKISDELRDVLLGLPEFEGAAELEVASLSETERSFVLERHLASLKLLTNGKGSSILVSEDEVSSAMLNEEDHLRFQVIHPGLSLGNAFRTAMGLVEAVGDRVEYAYRESLGYLTACPSNVGTGLRLSVLVHLPGIVYARDVESLLMDLTQRGILVRGLYGGGSNVQGNVFQVSSRISLGVTEEETLERFSEAVKGLLDRERSARDRLLSESRIRVEDKIYRSLAVLQSARILSFKEVAEFSSAVRLGVGLGILLDYRIRTLNELLFFSQPAHLQKLFSKSMDAQERDRTRASYIRAKLSSGSG
jgi:protein arginine kinase